MAKKKSVPTTLTSASKKKKLPAKVKLVWSKLAYKGKVFSVYTDDVIEPGGPTGSIESRRDVVRHAGSVVILAVDESANSKDPLVVVERQYRHAAGQYLLELPAGKRDHGETSLAAAKRELIEETGYRSRSWTKLVRYYPSPGFVGEWMEIWLARGIAAGAAHPEADECIQVSLMPLSELLKLVKAGKVHDGKTIIGALLYESGLKAGKF
jgi:ADP-ribose pyrophosphatase